MEIHLEDWSLIHAHIQPYKIKMTVLSDFISFQFFTSLYLRGENISAEVMKDDSLREWYLQKLEEMTKIDELRLNRTKMHRSQIITTLSSS